MRVATLFTALCCAQGITAGESWQRRQDSSRVASTSSQSESQSTSLESSTISVSSSSATESATSITSLSSTQPTSDASQSSLVRSSAKAASSSAGFQASSLPVSSSATTSAFPAATGSTSESADELPIQPKITPAIGLAGAFLILTGIALCVIGIKHDWLQVFLSTALLASLSVTVLIIYVMNPPVSDAVQGAYFVAALLTGCVFGGVAIVFKEVADGLGCLLGGFCFAMWLLVLAPGGIIHSTAGRGVLIGVFCVVCFSLSFSQYTRTYGLIGCTSFAGAMITILGVDCFSRAGLKEFWIYLWDLNNSEFPLGTTTYPITRGIRVEIACTIVIFLFGLMSQFKIWKVVKKHRTKRELERVRDEESRDQLEQAVGKKVEMNNTRDMAQWEAAYGEKSVAHFHKDSGVGSSIGTYDKASSSVRENEVDGIELANVPKSKTRRFSKRLSGILSGGQDNEAKGVARPASESRDGLVGAPDAYAISTKHNSLGSETARDQVYTAHSRDLFAPGAPSIVPLPFRLPNEPNEEVLAEDARSAASRSVWDSLPTVATPSAQIAQPLSLQRLRELHGTGRDETDGDGASSVAATADERPDVEGLFAATFDGNALMPPGAADRGDMSSRSSWHADSEAPLEDDDDDEALERPPTAFPDPVSPMAVRNTRKASTVTRPPVDSPMSPVDADETSLAPTTVDQLPSKFSKIAMTYRTNEWAKHIADADDPEISEAPEQDQPGVQVDLAAPAETAKPLDIQDLQQPTTVVAQPEPLVRKDSEVRAFKSGTPSKYIPNMSRASSAQSVTPVYAFNRSDSQMSLDRQGSSASLAHKIRTAGLSMRNSSAALRKQPVVESQIAEDLLAAKESSMSRGPTPDLSNHVPGSPQEIDDELMSLNQRRSTFQGRRVSNTTSPIASPTHRISSSQMIYDSHQPQRVPSYSLPLSTARLTQWRTSQLPAQSVQKSQQAMIAEEQARQILREERRQAEFRAERKKAEKAARDQGMERAMRSGALQDAHRDAMRRMQAKANNS